MLNFGTGKLIAVPTNLADGSVIATPTPVRLGTMQDISVDMSLEMKTVYGGKRYPLGAGQGKGKIAIKAKYADIDGKILGSLFYGKASVAGIKGAVFDNLQTVPASGAYTVTVAPPNSGTFAEDLGVLYSGLGVQLKRTDSATPNAGEYSVAAGVYTFNAADKSKAMLFSYEYTASSAAGEIFTITNEVMGYTPSFKLLLQNQYDGKTMVLKLHRCVSNKLNIPLKNDDYALYDFEAEAFANAADEVGYICLF
jgi:hypothetical protein